MTDPIEASTARELAEGTELNLPVPDTATPMVSTPGEARRPLSVEDADAIAAWNREHHDPRDEAEDEAEREYARAVEEGRDPAP